MGPIGYLILPIFKITNLLLSLHFCYNKAKKDDVHDFNIAP